MKTVSCRLEITAIVECPKCEQEFDLFEVDHLTDEGYLYRQVLRDDGFGTKNLDKQVECPDCSLKFKVGEIHW